MATEAVTEAATLDDVERLSGFLHGSVIGPGDEGYDAARRIWNGAIDRRPARIARCTGVADVVAAVRFARERGLQVAVRSGGHGVGGYALCDGGLVIDLSPMKGIRSIRWPARHGPRPACLGSSTARRSSSAWPPSAGSSPIPALQG